MRATKAVKVTVVSAFMTAVAGVGLWMTSPAAVGAVVPSGADVVATTSTRPQDTPATAHPADPQPQGTAEFDPSTFPAPPKHAANGTCNYCAYMPQSTGPK